MNGMCRSGAFSPHRHPRSSELTAARRVRRVNPLQVGTVRLPRPRNPPVPRMSLQELKRKSPAELVAFAEELHIENASSVRRHDIMFGILKQLADNDSPIYGDG